MGLSILEYCKRFEQAYQKMDEVIQNEVTQSKEVLLDLNRDQMLAGRNAEGEVLTPGYLEDPYFKTPEQAQAYKSMKEKLESTHRARMRFGTMVQFPPKDSNTPNLIVTGPFQDNMFIDVLGDKFRIGSTYSDSPDIQKKYDYKVFGISPIAKKFFWNNYLQPRLVDHFKTYLK